MRWTDPPSDHDHLLVLWWCPFLLYANLWGGWGPTGGLDALWLAWGQVGGGVFLWLAFHSRLGGEGQRAKLFLCGMITKPQQAGILCLDGLGVGALALAYVGAHGAAVAALGVAILGRMVWLRRRRVWLEEDSVWLGGFPLQRVRFAHLQHVWQEAQQVSVRDHRGRGFDLEAEDAQEAERWSQAILDAQKEWLLRSKEGFVAKRDAAGAWDVAYGGGEDFFASAGWSLQATEGHGQIPVLARWRSLLGWGLAGAWSVLWLTGKAVAWGMSAWWGRGILHFLLGLGACAVLCRLPGSWWPPLRATHRWYGPMRALRCYRVWAWVGLVGLGILGALEMVRFVGGGQAPHWTLWFVSVLSALIVALDPSSAVAWMARVNGEPWMRRVGWRERMPVERWEAVAWCRGMLFWKCDGMAFCAILPCATDAKEAAAWLFAKATDL